MGKVTVDLGDPTLYRDLRKTAAELDRPVRDIIAEALRQWLKRQTETLAHSALEED